MSIPVREVIYGESTLSTKGDDYAQMSVPSDVISDDRNDLDHGDRVKVVGVTEGDEQYLKLVPVR